MRFALSRELRLEAQAEAALGSRPALSMSGPLVPVPPRAAIWLGVAYRFGADGAKAAPAHRPEPRPLSPPQRRRHRRARRSKDRSSQPTAPRSARRA